MRFAWFCIILFGIFIVGGLATPKPDLPFIIMGFGGLVIIAYAVAKNRYWGKPIDFKELPLGETFYVEKNLRDGYVIISQPQKLPLMITGFPTELMKEGRSFKKTKEMSYEVIAW